MHNKCIGKKKKKLHSRLKICTLKKYGGVSSGLTLTCNRVSLNYMYVHNEVSVIMKYCHSVVIVVYNDTLQGCID